MQVHNILSWPAARPPLPLLFNPPPPISKHILSIYPVPDMKHFVAAHVPWLQRSGKHKGTMVPAGAPVDVIGTSTVQCSHVSIQPLASSSAGVMPRPVSSSSCTPACSAGQTGNLCGNDCFVHMWMLKRGIPWEERQRKQQKTCKCLKEQKCLRKIGSPAFGVTFLIDQLVSFYYYRPSCYKQLKMIIYTSLGTHCICKVKHSKRQISQN